MNTDYFIKVLIEWNGLIQSIEPEIKNDLYARAKSKNGWFTSDSIDLAFKGLDNYLDPENLNKWINSFNSPDRNKQPKKVGIVMAGNIPVVGFHDLLCVIATGHKALVKLSSQDSALIPYILDLLYRVEPSFKEHISVVEKLEKPDAVIATGSNNSARYFNYYFKSIPHIIRKNRTSIAILNGRESADAFNRLGSDILSYFGLGCRSISKLYVPAEYNFTHFFESIQSHEHIFNTQKYVNNYDYNKSIYLVNREKFLDNGFLMLKPSDQLVSPVSVVFFENYISENDLETKVKMNKGNIQCIVSEKAWYKDSIDMGKTQEPDLWDYSDNVNTVDFLNRL